jgi:hypothetical protein
MVIGGWDQGLLDMCIGEKRKLTIPPHLGVYSKVYNYSMVTLEQEMIFLEDPL